MGSDYKFSHEELIKIGLRIKSARTLTGFNQEEFAKKFNLGQTTLKHWENGYVLPRKTGLEKLCDALRSMGVYTNIDWIFYAKGTLSLDSENEALLKQPNKSTTIEFFCKKCDPDGKNVMVFRV